MTAYAGEHFETEEALMAQAGYPALEEHVKEHRVYKARTVSLCLDTMASKAFVPVDILVFLRDWWTGHVLGSDMKYKAFLVGGREE
jgi:hemerythrin